MIEVENDERYWVYTIPSIEDGETKKRIKALEYNEDCSLRSIVISDTIEEIGREALISVGILKILSLVRV